eukprot:c8571_g1_i1.p1 GENE.c8571_g1_i1~~c8571_g1_i1.p1  ORF type:complete len:671 (-),score=213.78 c8571_g1_i1:1192-3072(-)
MENSLNEKIGNLEARLVEEENKRAQEKARADQSEDQIATLEVELAQLKSEHDSTVNKYSLRIAELQSSADAACAVADSCRREAFESTQAMQQASARYDRELLQHAAHVQQLSDLRKENVETKHNLAITQQLLTEAQASVTQIQAAFNEERAKFTQQLQAADEITTLLRQQNEILHNQLDAQAQQLSRASHEQVDMLMVGDDQTQERRDEDMRNVLVFLRRDNEMMLCKLELAARENSRLKSECTSFQRRIDQLTLQLQTEIERGRAKEDHELQHQQLLEKVNQLKLIRETNALLKEECAENARMVNFWKAKAEGMETEILPLKEEISSLRNEVASVKAEKDAAQLESSRWCDRVTQLMNKYKRIDPAEHESLKREKQLLEGSVKQKEDELNNIKSELQALVRQKESELAAALLEKEALTKKVEELNNTITQKQEDANKLSRVMRQSMLMKNQLDSVKKTLTEEKEALARTKDAEIAQLTASLAQAQANPPSSELQEKIVKAEARIQQLLDKGRVLMDELKAEREKNAELDLKVKSMVALAGKQQQEQKKQQESQQQQQQQHQQQQHHYHAQQYEHNEERSEPVKANSEEISIELPQRRLGTDQEGAESEPQSSRPTTSIGDDFSHS